MNQMPNTSEMKDMAVAARPAEQAETSRLQLNDVEIEAGVVAGHIIKFKRMTLVVLEDGDGLMVAGVNSPFPNSQADPTLGLNRARAVAIRSFESLWQRQEQWNRDRKKRDRQRDHDDEPRDQPWDNRRSNRDKRPARHG